MLFNKALYIGIDPAGKGRPLTYAALDHNLEIIALKKAQLRDVLAFVGGQKEAVVAVNGPQRPNQGMMNREEVRQSLTPVPSPGRWTNFRVAEYQLFQHNIRIPHTDARQASCQGWMRVCFGIYTNLREFGYREYYREDIAQQYMEVYPYASFAVLLGTLPFQKKTLEGRLQRQVLLFSKGVGVPNAMRIFEEITRHRLLKGILPLERLHSPEELDALAAAYTAWYAVGEPGKSVQVGAAGEGKITLPCPVLEAKY